MSLQGKRSELLEEISDMKQFRMQGKVMDVYDDRKAAKKTLKLFKENGWIEIKTHGVFEVTEEGRKKADAEENSDNDSSLSSFTG